jgi:hypothetical protein
VFHRRSDRRASRGVADKIGLAVGALLGRRKVAKHFRITIANDALSFTRDHAAIATEAALDGFYVLRTNVPADALDAAEQCAPFLMSRVCCMSCARDCARPSLSTCSAGHHRDAGGAGYVRLLPQLSIVPESAPLRQPAAIDR